MRQEPTKKDLQEISMAILEKLLRHHKRLMLVNDLDTQDCIDIASDLQYEMQNILIQRAIELGDFGDSKTQEFYHEHSLDWVYDESPSHWRV